MRCSLLARIQSAPGEVLEELKLRLQLKDRLFQEVLADRTRQAQQHQDQVQDLIRTIGSRDQYIQEAASRLDEVMAEQTARLTELRRQLNATSRPESAEEVRVLQEELRLVLRREKENQELGRSLEAASRRLQVKDDIIRVSFYTFTFSLLFSDANVVKRRSLSPQDFQKQLVDPAALPLVERLTQEVQELREGLFQQEGPPARGPVLGRDRPEFGGGHQRSMGQYL